ncbi:MAG: hypothetical protein L6R30_09920 [Thermoanaerobaculia bacterium]|nr:hypothetical protein [Thermoanaerobaculia bacterium]
MRVDRAAAWAALLLALLLAADQVLAQTKNEKPAPLTPEEIAQLERETARACGIRPDVPESRLPWFYSYVLAGKLLERGEATQALGQLNRALRKRPRPAKGERVYGLWFLDYLPYSMLARIHDSLNQPECAQHARDVARVLEPASRPH